MKYVLSELTTAKLLELTVREKNGEDILSRLGGLRKLADATPDDIAALGIGRAAAVKLMAIFEIAKRVASAPEHRVKVGCPDDVVALLKDMETLDRECFKTISLGTKNHVLAVTTVSIGGLDFTVAAPREVFKVPIMRSAASIILVHNHPSGDPEPSYQDQQLTRRLRECGSTLGVEVIDHIIIGQNCHVSMKERGLL